MGTGKGPAKGSKGDDSTLPQDIPFFTVAPQKGKDFAPKGGKKGKNKGKDKGGHKALKGPRALTRVVVRRGF